MTLRKEARLWAKRTAYAVGYFKGPILWWLASGQIVRRLLIVGRAPIFDVWGELRTGKDLRLRGIQIRSQISVAAEAKIVFGDRVSINQGSVLHAEKLIRVGNRVSIGDRVRIYDTNFHPVKPGGRVKTAPVFIEDDVWLASGVTILPGVTIGRGAVIGTGCVVSSDVPAGSVLKPPSPELVFRYEVFPEMRRR